MNINNQIRYWARLINESEDALQIENIDIDKDKDDEKPHAGLHIEDWFDENGNETEQFKTDAGFKEEWKSLKNGHKIITFVVPNYGCSASWAEEALWNILRVNYDTVTKKTFQSRGFNYGNKKFRTKDETVSYIRELEKKVNWDDSKHKLKHSLNEESTYSSNEIKKHFDDVIEDIVKEVVSECKIKHHDIRHYEEYLVDYILERSEELIKDAIEVEEYETDEQLKFFIEQNMDSLIEGFIEDNAGDFDEDGEWTGEMDRQGREDDYRSEY